jgi:phage N-6-adenine-methyltransferase
MAFFKTKFESHKQEWATPNDLFLRLNKEFHFTLDLAADATNTKCDRYYDASIDALVQDWKGVCWLNPPYGAKQYKLSNWIKKAYQETQKPDCTVVMLIPARTNTRWWHDYCMQAAEIRFLNGRPKFGDAKHGLPQPLALIVFKLHKGLPKLKSYPAKGAA